jgi:putative Holliday junction resolvase
MKDPVFPAAETDSTKGRILALDLGEKRIGIAISDETRMIARSLEVMERGSRLADFERIGQIVDEQGVTLLIVGLPLLASGEEGQKASWMRDYARDLQGRLGLTIQFWDESYTTVQAEASLRDRGVHGRRRRRRVDAVAAAIILQSYLDSQHRS